MKSYIATEAEIQEIYNQYHAYLKSNNNPSVRYFFKLATETITIYTNNRVFIQNGEKQITNTNFVAHCGSDESGVGDYFGPLTVCATIVEEKHHNMIQQLNIKDSKQMRDDYILKIAPKLMEILPYSLLILDNEKYNEQVEIHNSHGLKALLHNQAYINLAQKYQLPQLKVVDQFCSENNYYKYLKGKEIIKVHLETKAENKFLAVACASVIARYAYLTAMKQLSAKYHVEFLLGAGSHVDELGKQLVAKHGVAILQKTAKYHFANTKKIIGDTE